MTDEARRDSENLIRFWGGAFALSGEDMDRERRSGAEGWKALAPSEKLFRAASALGRRKKVLDYGCGSAWAGIIAAKCGCPDVTAVDVAQGAVETARFYAGLCGAGLRLRCVEPDWLRTVPAETYEGIVCSNVLDVVPPEISEAILRELARIAAPDAEVLVGLNYYLSPEAAAERQMPLAHGNRLYVEGVLRLVSRTDEAWADLLSPGFTVERLEHFAWPGEAEERRRLFHLRRRAAG